MSPRVPDRDDAPDGEPFLARWSRRKAEQAATVDPAPEAESPPDPGAAPPEAAAPTPTDADLPPPESLDDGADFSGFLSPGVSEALRRRAFAHLFSSPRYNVADGLDDYAEDFSRFEGLGDRLTHEMRRLLEREIEKQGDEGPRLAEAEEPTAGPTGAAEAVDREGEAEGDDSEV